MRRPAPGSSPRSTGRRRFRTPHSHFASTSCCAAVTRRRWNRADHESAHHRVADCRAVCPDRLRGFFRGFGRSLTDANGGYRFATIKPGRVPGPGGVQQAPHIAVTIFMRGLLKQLFTRVYFADDPANAQDPVLSLVPAERRATLIARRSATDKSLFEWNVSLQGRDETVFFDY